jgi:PAS domain S-box-containing protein
MQQNPSEQARGALGKNDALWSWTGSTGLAMAVGITYFLGARLSLALLTAGGVAVFWPAAGIASGLLITLGSQARTPVAIGVISATIVANLLGDRNLASTLVFALCNAGEAVLIAWLYQRWVGPGYQLDSLRGVVGFFAAAAVATAVSGIGGAMGFVLFHSSGTPFLVTWLNWLASDAIGVVTIAPLIIGLAHTLYDRPAKPQIAEGLLTLAVLAMLSAIAFGAPRHHWFTILPIALLLPLLLWLAARHRPMFAAAALFILALAIVWTITFGIGRLGDPSIPLVDRVYAAQAALLAISTYALVLAALFAERRRGEAVLKSSNDRLQLALDSAELGVWSLHLRTGLFENDVRDRRIHGHHPEMPPTTLAQARSCIHADDLPNLDAAFAAAGNAGGNYRTEYRLAPLAEHRHTGHERWVSVEGTVVRGADGSPARLLGVTRDITERKNAELALAERNAQIALAGRAALVGSYVLDVNAGAMQVSEGYAAIHGLPEGTTETTRAQWRSRVHPEDLERVERLRDQTFADQREESHIEYRIVRADGEVRWIERRSIVSYNSQRRPQRIVGITIDVTERKRVEEHQRVLVAELDHRVKNALATVNAVVSGTLHRSSSAADFAAALVGRVQSMARAHELLSLSRWLGISLAELIRREFAPYATRNNTEINGPDIILGAEAGQAVAMVLHELVTNAAKYGALSTQDGRVLVRWDRQPRANPRAHLVVEWQEVDGPSVVASSKSGYGTSIVRELIPHELGGVVDFSLAKEGVRCRLEIPGERLTPVDRFKFKGSASEFLPMGYA